MAKNLNDVLATYARDIFRKQADCDYISARANYRMRLSICCFISLASGLLIE